MEALNKFEDIWKVEKWTPRGKQVTIKEIEDKIIDLVFNPSYQSEVKSLVEKKDNQITRLKKMKIPTIQLFQTTKITQVQKGKGIIYANYVQ